MSLLVKTIVVGSRRSLLARKQVEEVLKELRVFHPHTLFQSVLSDTRGDCDHKTSLRTLEKTDFFTREVDALVLDGTCRIAIHSAKDLPEPLSPGIALIALTKGVDSSDVLVFRDGDHLDTLPSPACVGSSAARRDAAVKKILPDARCIDIRGTIENRLAQLDEGNYDAVVMAEAALIRLELQHRNRLRLPGASAPLQGRLAVVAREDDLEMKQLFACLNRPLV